MKKLTITITIFEIPDKAVDQVYKGIKDRVNVALYNMTYGNQEYGALPLSALKGKNIHTESEVSVDEQLLFRVKLTGGGYLGGKNDFPAAITPSDKEHAYLYTRGEAIKKARRFSGEIEMSE